MRKTRCLADGGGVDFIEALTLLFIGLKLTGTIEWSWWWVLSPIWISLAVAIGLVIIIYILKAIRDSIEDSFTS